MSERPFTLTEQEMKTPRRKRRQGAKPTSPALFSTALCVGPGSSLETHVNEAMTRDMSCGTALVNALGIMCKMDCL